MTEYKIDIYKETDKYRPICERCKSGYVYIKNKGKIIVCRRCGFETEIIPKDAK